MSDSYAFKATLTMVLNDDDYNMGITFNDSNGSSLDKQLNGKIDDFEQDITKVVLETYLDAAHKKEEAKKTTEPKPTITTNADTTTGTVDRLSELEEENRRLNQKIETLLRKKECKSENDKADGGSVHTKFSRKPETVTTTFEYGKDVESVLRLLGLY